MDHLPTTSQGSIQVIIRFYVDYPHLYDIIWVIYGYVSDLIWSTLPYLLSCVCLTTCKGGKSSQKAATWHNQHWTGSDLNPKGFAVCIQKRSIRLEFRISGNTSHGKYEDMTLAPKLSPQRETHLLSCFGGDSRQSHLVARKLGIRLPRTLIHMKPRMSIQFLVRSLTSSYFFGLQWLETYPSAPLQNRYQNNPFLEWYRYRVFSHKFQFQPWAPRTSPPKSNGSSVSSAANQAVWEFPFFRQTQNGKNIKLIYINTPETIIYSIIYWVQPS